MTPVIRVEDLQKTFRPDIRAVDGVTFEIGEREIFAFLGPNGAGKTTTIRMLITLVKPTGGRAEVCGIDVSRHPARVRECIGYVSQDLAVDEELTGRDNLRLQGHFYHLPGAVLRERIEEVLATVDLTDRADDVVEHYSGGMRKRLDIASALIHRPQVLFLDEPTLGLDIQTRHRIWDYVNRLRSEHGVTIFLTTHYMDEADALADRIAIIDRGRIVAMDTPDALKRGLGNDLVTVELARPDAMGRALSAVDALPDIHGNERGTDGSLRLSATDGAAAIPRVMSCLTEAGVEVSSVSVKRPTLDDVFLHFTGHELRDQGSDDDVMRMRRVMGRARSH